MLILFYWTALQEVPFLLCRIGTAAEVAGIVVQVTLEDLPKMVGTGEILGQAQGAVLFQPDLGAAVEHFCHKIGADITVLDPPGDTGQAQRQTDLGISQSLPLLNIGLQIVADTLVGFFRNVQRVKFTGEGLAAGLVIAHDIFHNEALHDKTVEGIHVFFQTDGNMGIIAAGIDAQGFGFKTGELGQQDKDFALAHLTPSR